MSIDTLTQPACTACKSVCILDKWLHPYQSRFHCPVCQPDGAPVSRAEMERMIAEFRGWTVKPRGEMWMLMRPDGLPNWNAPTPDKDEQWTFVPKLREIAFDLILEQSFSILYIGNQFQAGSGTAAQQYNRNMARSNSLEEAIGMAYIRTRVRQ